MKIIPAETRYRCDDCKYTAATIEAMRAHEQRCLAKRSNQRQLDLDKRIAGMTVRAHLEEIQRLSWPGTRRGNRDMIWFHASKALEKMD